MPLCMLLCGPKIRNKDLVFLYSCIKARKNLIISIVSDHRRTVWKVGSNAKNVLLLKYEKSFLNMNPQSMF